MKDVDAVIEWMKDKTITQIANLIIAQDAAIAGLTKNNKELSESYRKALNDRQTGNIN